MIAIQHIETRQEVCLPSYLIHFMLRAVAITSDTVYADYWEHETLQEGMTAIVEHGYLQVVDGSCPTTTETVAYLTAAERKEILRAMNDYCLILTDALAIIPNPEIIDRQNAKALALRKILQ